MIICVKIGEREIIKTKSHSWTSSHFTWGEGNQETYHVLTTTFFSTTIKIYVDNIDSYINKKGQTSDLEIDYIPSINDKRLSDLTGMMIVSNHPYQSWPSWEKIIPIPALSPGLYAFVNDIQADSHSYIYERIKITDKIDNLFLARTIIARTIETYEESD